MLWFFRGAGAKKAAAVLLVVAHGRRASGGKNGEAHFRISHILLTQIEMLCVNVCRSDANRARSVLSGLGVCKYRAVG